MPRVSHHDNSGSTMWLIGIILTMFQFCCYHSQSHYQHVLSKPYWNGLMFPDRLYVMFLTSIWSWAVNGFIFLVFCTSVLES